LAVTIKKHEEILDILSRACGRRELLILSTPFLRFESSFVAIEGNELHVLATMSRDDAVYGLRTPELKIRFPHGLGFYEAAVTSIGLGLHEGRRTIRVSIPKVIKENDQRVGYRVERVGRVPVTLGTPKANLHLAGLVDISTSGAQVHAQKDVPQGELEAGDQVVLDIPLSDQISIHSGAVVRHISGRRIGLQFNPKLPPEVEDPLSRWVFLRREEELERAARRMEEANAPELRMGSLIPERSIVFVSSDTELEAQIKEILKDTRPVVRLAPTVPEVKEAMMGKPSLAILHIAGTGLDDRRRMKTLCEIAQRKVPILLLGSRVDGATLFEFSNEWKASSAMVWSPERATFLQRLVQGMLRRHEGGGAGPMAPQEGHL
jgi:hypothetical protein